MSHVQENAGREAGELKQAIEREVASDLEHCGYHEMRRVSCEYDHGVVTLRGRVPSYFLKQIAQTVVASRLKGTAALRNQLEVRGW